MYSMRVFLSLVMLAAAAVLTSCAKREASRSFAPSRDVADETTMGASASSDPAAASTRAAPAGADMDDVAESKAQFDSLVEALEQYGGDEQSTVLNTNTLDVAAFVKGKSEQDLLRFVYEVRFSSPVAAKQVAQYLVQNTSDGAMLRDAAESLRFPVMLAGEKDDVPFMQETFDRLLETYAGEPPERIADPANAERWFNFFHSYAVLLHDSGCYARIASTLRAAGRSNFEQTLADWAECHWICTDPARDDVDTVSLLCRRIQDRGVYGENQATREQVKLFLRDARGSVEDARSVYKNIQPFYMRPDNQHQEQGDNNT